MSRKNLTIEDWKDSITLLIITLQDHNINFNEIVVARSKIENIDGLSPNECTHLEIDLGEFCNKLSKDIWEVFLKKRRDKKYEKASSRKRLSVNSATFEALSKFIKKNNLDNANQAIGYLLKNCSHDEEDINQKGLISLKCNEGINYRPLLPKTSINVKTSKTPVVQGIWVDGVQSK